MIVFVVPRTGLPVADIEPLESSEAALVELESEVIGSGNNARNGSSDTHKLVLKILYCSFLRQVPEKLCVIWARLEASPATATG